MYQQNYGSSRSPVSASEEPGCAAMLTWSYPLPSPAAASASQTDSPPVSGPRPAGDAKPSGVVEHFCRGDPV